MIYIILFIVIAYLLGSIPTSVWVSKTFYGIDIRKEGSGNAGASNTFRVLGKKAGIPVLLFDVIKGWLAANLIFFYPDPVLIDDKIILIKIVLGICAVIGHIFPVFIGFKGGKGIATLFGMVLGIHWQAAALCLIIFLLMLILTKYVSVSSIIATCAFPVLAVFVFTTSEKPLIIFGLIVSVLVVITHHKNIGRLMRGEENKANLLKKKNCS